MKHAVHYLDHRDGWTPTNLGWFDTAAEAQAASRHWLDGYARTHDGYRPPVSVRPVHQAPTPAP